MIQTILLSTAVAFSVQVGTKACPGYDGYVGRLCLDLTTCQAFEKVQGYEWSDLECEKDWENYRKLKHERYKWPVYIPPPLCERTKKILWHKMVGLCDDGTVRWKEIKP